VGWVRVQLTTLAALAVLGSTVVAFAIGIQSPPLNDIDELRVSMADTQAAAVARFERASRLQPNLVDPGMELPWQQCLNLKGRIKSSSKIDPFEFIFEGGAVYSAFCVPQQSGRRNFISMLPGFTSFRLPYTTVVTLDGPRADRIDRTAYFIDANSRIVEIQAIVYDDASQQIVEFAASALDREGDVYFTSLNRRYRIDGWETDGVYSAHGFIAGDGSHPRPIWRRQVTHASDRSKDLETLELHRADVRDWQDFQLPITHSWSGGFYNYDNLFFKDARNTRSLILKWQGSQLKHACGEHKAGTKWKQIPSDKAAYDSCLAF
jgi:hypothetical protein